MSNTLRKVFDRFLETVGSQPTCGQSRRLLSYDNIKMLGDTVICSYGAHFPIAALQETDGVEWWLLNGDTATITTTRHQTLFREALIWDNRARAMQGLPERDEVIIPFSALDALGRCERHTSWRRVEAFDMGIKMVENLGAETRWTLSVLSTPPSVDVVFRLSPDGDSLRRMGDGELRVAGYHSEYPVKIEEPAPTLVPDSAGKYHVYLKEHFLGASVFTYEGHHYLSAFDSLEVGRHYFLCRLPGPVDSVQAALESLKPPEVNKALENGVQVFRQGDIFAVEVTPPFTKRGEMEKAGWEYRSRGRSFFPQRGTPVSGDVRILNTSHTVSYMFVKDGVFYGMGTMYHNPRGGRPAEHARRKLGDGKTWFRFYRNTVPLQENGDPFSWSIAGRVD